LQGQRIVLAEACTDNQAATESVGFSQQRLPRAHVAHDSSHHDMMNHWCANSIDDMNET
jgi:hypothetical protein